MHESGGPLTKVPRPKTPARICISHLPNEILLRIFVTGSVLPARPGFLADEILEWKRFPPRLKLFAKVVSYVCSAWHEIVMANKQQLSICRVILALGSSFTVTDNIIQYLGQYMQDLKNSGDCDIDLLWYCSKTVALDADSFSPEATEVRLFMHGMALSSAFLPRVRRLEVVSMQSEALHLCFSLLNRLGKQGSRLVWINVNRGFRFGKLGVEARRGSLQLWYPFREKETAACKFAESLPALSDLYIAHVAVLPAFGFPLKMQHLHLSGCCSAEKHALWADLISLLQGAPNLQTLHLGLPYVSGLPREAKVVTCMLPAVESLHLDGSTVLFSLTLLSCLSLPRLQRLSFVRIVRSDRQLEDGDIRLPDHRPERAEDKLLAAPSFLAIEWIDLDVLGHILIAMDLDSVEELSVFLPEDFPGPQHLTSPSNYEFAKVQRLYLYQLESAHIAGLLDRLSLPAARRATLVYGNPVLEGPVRLTRFWRTLTTNQDTFLSGLTHIEIDLPQYEPDAPSHPFAPLTMVEHFTVTGIELQNVAGLEWLLQPPVPSSPRSVVLPKLEILELVINPSFADSFYEIGKEIQSRVLLIHDFRNKYECPLERVILRDLDPGMAWAKSFST